MYCERKCFFALDEQDFGVELDVNNFVVCMVLCAIHGEVAKGVWRAGQLVVNLNTFDEERCDKALFVNASESEVYKC